MFVGNASGHDFQFHIASWMDAAGQWRQGIIYPRWAEWANWGFGEPRFIFYPPASWMIGGALGTVLPWAAVPGVFVWLALVAAGMSMWRLAREWLPASAAAWAAVLFAVNPYHLAIVYYRSDFAELLAWAIVPVMLGSGIETARGNWRRMPVAAAAFAGIWLANAPAAVIATYSLAILFAVASVLQRTARPLLRGAVATAGGFGLAAFYILPAAWERRWVQIGQIVADNLSPARNFLFTRANEPDFVKFNWRISSVAVGMMAVTAIAAALASRKRREMRESFWVLAAIALASILLMLPFTGFIWRDAPELGFVQFPWRWLGQLGVAFALFVAAAMSAARRRWAARVSCVALLVAVLAAGKAMIGSAWWDSGDVPALAGAIQSGGGYRGTDEYDPVGCDRYELPGDPDQSERTEGVSAVPAQPIEELDPDSGEIGAARAATIRVEKWSAERREFSEQAGEPITLAVRLLIYPAWDVRVDGREVRPGAVRDTGQMLLPVAPGAHRVDIRFRRTWDRLAGDAIAILSAVSLLAFAGWRRRSSS